MNILEYLQVSLDVLMDTNRAISTTGLKNVVSALIMAIILTNKQAAKKYNSRLTVKP